MHYLSWLSLLLLVLGNLLGYVGFLQGFFPSKPVLLGHSQWAGKSPFGENGPKFDKVVLMVVDALRADLIFGDTSEFSFVHSLISEGQALPFTGFSNPPTVTLPRLKGITTGTTPNFLDAILNIADDKDSSQGLLSQDSWLYQFKNKGKTIDFYGDDTWLKLFPGDFFGQSDGTNSFFVSDFWDVDNNVTRHLDEELSASANWDGLILHYLGLDHIGHKTGPNSRFMNTKQKEMDGIVKRIYQFLSKSKKHKDTLFVLMGDHGMNDIGNHGGSSPGETNAALMFISPKFEALKKQLKAPLPVTDNYEFYTKINQIDLVPTLSMLLDLPIPKNNLGIMMKDFLPLFNKKNAHKIVLENCKQFFNIIQQKFKNDAKKINYYQSLLDKLSVEKDVDADYQFLSDIQDFLIASSSSYNYSLLHISLVACAICTVLVVFVFNACFAKVSLWREVAIFQVFTAVYAIHFHGSSLIEEEHHIWWFFTVIFALALLFLLKFKSLFHCVSLLACLRIMKTWCNTGQKYSTEQTTANFLLENPSLLWGLIILTYFVLSILIYLQGSFRFTFNLVVNEKRVNLSYADNDVHHMQSFIIVFIVSSLSIVFKLFQAFIDDYKIPSWLSGFLTWNLVSFNVDPNDKSAVLELLTNLSTLAFYGCGGLILCRVLAKYVRKFRVGYLTDIINVLTMLLIHQTKIELIPMFLVFFVMKANFSKIIANNPSLFSNVDQLVYVVTVFTLLVSNNAFFLMGGTNSLATVDLSNAYNGVKSYKIEIVSLLTFVSNFSGPIFWSLSSLQLLLENNVLNFKNRDFHKDFYFMKTFKYNIIRLKALVSLFFYSVSALSLIGSCYNLKFHLFIWTVFSPKLLYFGVWFVLVNVVVDLGLTALLLIL